MTSSIHPENKNNAPHRDQGPPSWNESSTKELSSQILILLFGTSTNCYFFKENVLQDCSRLFLSTVESDGPELHLDFLFHRIRYQLLSSESVVIDALCTKKGTEQLPPTTWRFCTTNGQFLPTLCFPLSKRQSLRLKRGGGFYYTVKMPSNF